MLLEKRNAIIYGAGGGIGGGVARTFAREGAAVFLAGRTGPPLEGGRRRHQGRRRVGRVAVRDATDERAVDAHAEAVAADAGRIDVSFNLISRGDVQRTPLVDMTTDDLLRAVVTGLKSKFRTARAAARRMTRQGSGVILHLNSASGAGAMPGMGSTGPADAATESFMRYLAAEVGPHGVRVLGIHTAGVVETLTQEGLDEVGGEGAPDPETVEGMIASMAMLRALSPDAGSFEEAEDLVQETLLRAWRRCERLQGGPGFRAWLDKIAANACLDALRSRRITMSPHPWCFWCFDGLDAIRPLLEQGLTEPGEWRLVPTRANRQPRIAEITTFDATLFPEFGLPPTL